jgi:hypothetical protein
LVFFVFLSPALILPQGRFLGSAQTLSNTDGTDFTDVRQETWEAFAKKQGANLRPV